MIVKGQTHVQHFGIKWMKWRKKHLNKNFLWSPSLFKKSKSTAVSHVLNVFDFLPLLAAVAKLSSLVFPSVSKTSNIDERENYI